MMVQNRLLMMVQLVINDVVQGLNQPTAPKPSSGWLAATISRSGQPILVPGSRLTILRGSVVTDDLGRPLGG